MEVTGVVVSVLHLNETVKKLERMNNAHRLLNDKSMVIMKKMSKIYHEMASFCEQIFEISQEAHMTMANVNYFNSEFKSFALADTSFKAQTHVIHTTSEMSKKIYNLTFVDDGPEPLLLAGLSMGGQQILDAKHKFRSYLTLLIDNLNSKKTFIILEEEYKLTLRKVNVIEKLIIPRILETIAYMKTSLDDIEREEIYRIKKVKTKLKRKAENVREYRRLSQELDLLERARRASKREMELLDTHSPQMQFMNGNDLKEIISNNYHIFVIPIIMAVISYISYKSNYN